MKTQTRLASLVFLVALFPAAARCATDTPVYFAPEPGAAKAEANRDGFSIANAVLRMSWRTSADGMHGLEFTDAITHRTISAQPVPFILLFGDGSVLAASEMAVVQEPKIVDLEVQAGAARLSERLPGKAVAIELADKAGRLRATWTVILRDGSNYVRQEFKLTAGSGDVPVREVRLVDWKLANARVVGTVKGSPIVAGTILWPSKIHSHRVLSPLNGGDAGLKESCH